MPKRIDIECSGCGRTFTLIFQAWGARTRCPNCGQGYQMEHMSRWFPRVEVRPGEPEKTP